jgi:hypothetical protein
MQTTSDCLTPENGRKEGKEGRKERRKEGRKGGKPEKELESLW